MKTIQRSRDERGTTPVEYALIVAVCALVLVASVALFRGAMDVQFKKQQDQVSTW